MPRSIEMGLSVLMAIPLALFLNLFIGVTDVYQHSMRTTLHSGDRLMVLKVHKHVGSVSRGQVVTFHLEGQLGAFVKRIIALPGEKVDIREGQILINGVVLDEPYARGPTVPGALPLPYTVPAGSYFMLGDNRNQSNDSRMFGAVAHERLVGLVLFRFWPPNNVHGSFDHLYSGEAR